MKLILEEKRNKIKMFVSNNRYKIFLLLFIYQISINLVVSTPINSAELNPSATTNIYKIESETASINNELNYITSDQVSPIVQKLLGSMETDIKPLLGTMAPLSKLLAPIIRSNVTDLLTSILNHAAQLNVSDIEENQTLMANINAQDLAESSKQKESKDRITGTLDEFLVPRSQFDDAIRTTINQNHQPKESNKKHSWNTVIKKKILKNKLKKSNYIISLDNIR